MAQMNISMKKRITDTEQTCGCQGRRGLGEEWKWEVRVSRYKLLYIEWINNKVCQYQAEK